MGCIFGGQHEASFMWEIQLVLASQDQHIEFCLAVLSTATLSSSQSTLMLRWAYFIFKKPPPPKSANLLAFLLLTVNESLIGSVWVMTDTP